MFLKKWIQTILEYQNRHFPCDRILAQRIFKCIIHTTVSFIFCLIFKVRNVLGDEPAMLPLISVIVHPGRRLSATIQHTFRCSFGLLLGLAYSLLGRFIAQRCLGSSWNVLTEKEQYKLNYRNYEAALGILALFECVMLFYHGWMRSVNHHYFATVFPTFLVVHFAFTDSLTQGPGQISKAYSTPFYLGIAMALFWNVVLFPEYGSTYLGTSTIDCLNHIHKAVDNSVYFFTSIDDQSDDYPGKEPMSLGALLKYKNTLEKKIQQCNMVLKECIYEISYSYVSPSQLDPVITIFKYFALNINGLINACQLEFISLGKAQDDIDVEREMKYADYEKLRDIMSRLKPNINELNEHLSKCLYYIKLLLAYSYDVSFDKIHTSDIYTYAGDSSFVYKNKSDFIKNYNEKDFVNLINELQEKVKNFEEKFSEELLHVNYDILTPNDEMFLLSSFLMNFKECSYRVVTMMSEISDIFNYRKTKEAKGWLRGKTVWFTFWNSIEHLTRFYTGTSGDITTGVITESQGFQGGMSGKPGSYSAGVVIRPQYEENQLLDQQSNNIESNEDEEKDAKKTLLPISKTTSITETSNKNIRSFIKWLYRNCRGKWRPHFIFGLQVTMALIISSIPMFVPKARNWYVDMHGPWIGFVCILCMEPNVGGTFWVFFLRGVGVVVGSAWAYLSYVAGHCHHHDPYLETVIAAIGTIPGFYLFLATPYVKAAIILLISIYIVMLAAIIPGSIGGGILENFAKRCFAVGYGGGVALIVQVILFPVKARDQLNEELSFVGGCVAEMILLYASGLDGQTVRISITDERFERYLKLSTASKAALIRAEEYLELTRQEPRLKGNYTELKNVFTQVIFVERQIIDRLDNIVLLRKKYGSAIIEELNHITYPYRRQLIASMVCDIRAVQEGIINKSPLPQYLPSPRIAHRRLINKVREVLHKRYASALARFENDSKMLDKKNTEVSYNDSDNKEESDDDNEGIVIRSRKDKNKTSYLSPHDYVLKEKFLSWNASTAATEEIIEYMEELIELTKILVGVNEFKYGFLSRPLYVDWAADAVVGFDKFIKGGKLKKSNSFSNTTTTATTDGPNNELSSIINEDSESLPSSLSDAAVSRSNSSYAENPVPFNEGKTYHEDGINLARIASHKSDYSNNNNNNNNNNDSNLGPRLRKRAFSIGSIDLSLNKIKTLGESIPITNSDASDDDLPLALKKIVSNKTKRKMDN